MAQKYFTLKMLLPQETCEDGIEKLAVMVLVQQGRLLSAHARERKERFVHALRERAVFGAAEFDNRTFEGESFFLTGPL